MTTIDAVSRTQIIWVFDDRNESNTAPGDSPPFSGQQIFPGKEVF